MASGFAVSEGSSDDPQLSPVGYLNDLLCGQLAATGVMAALLRRAREGGTWHVKVSLVQSAMWVQRLGLLQPDTYADKPGVPNTDDFDVALTKVDSQLGEVTYLADPVQYSTMPVADVGGPVSFGCNKPEWW
jgi:crotonobetainyl-CoA:carnitine CoA-transferase CaiB-like acyl-CoA transferase